MKHTGLQFQGLPLDTTLCGSFSKCSVRFLSAVLKEVISISLWPAVEAGLPDWLTQYKQVVILQVPLSLKLNNALKDFFSFFWSSVISGP